MRLETSKKITRKPSEYLKMFYFDTIIHSSEALDYLINLVGPEQVMVGSDYPFDMGSYQFNDLLNEINISEADRKKIKSENAKRLFQV